MVVKKLLLVVLFLFSISFVGCSNEESTSSLELPFLDAPNPHFTVSEDSLEIKGEDISLIPLRTIMSTQYDHVRFEITNNSPYTLYLDNTSYIYEEIDGEYILVDSDGDGKTTSGLGAIDTVDSGKTERIGIYLGEIRKNETTRVGKYKIELPINEEIKTINFEIVDDDISLDTGISIKASKDKYAIGDDENFSYTVSNDSEDAINVTLDVIISQYQDGKWISLPFTEKYYEIYEIASFLSERCQANSQLERQFSLSLSEMVDKKLSAGKYRVEKKIHFDWYFSEFEVI